MSGYRLFNKESVGMEVVKRQIKDYDGLVNDTLYCINDNGKLIYCMKNYEWSAVVTKEKDIEEQLRWNQPYSNCRLETELKDLMVDVYRELIPKKNEKNVQRERDN